MNKFDELEKIYKRAIQSWKWDEVFADEDDVKIEEIINQGKELENENMMLKTKLSMYEQLNEIFNKHSFRLDRMREWTDLPLLESRVLNDIEELLKQIKELENE